jgi:hypothetical protein
MKLIYTEARNILGDDLITPDEITRARSFVYNGACLRNLDDTLPTADLLYWCRDNGMMLVAGPPTAMSLVDVRALHADYFYSNGPEQDDCGWYNEPSEKFVNTDKVEALAWIAVRKESVEDSFSKNWSEQQALVQEPMVIPNAAEVVWALTTYKAARDVYLLENLYVRTSSVDSDGDRVYVGDFDDEGLYVGSLWDDGRGSGLGVSAARRF